MRQQCVREKEVVEQQRVPGNEGRSKGKEAMVQQTVREKEVSVEQKEAMVQQRERCAGMSRGTRAAGNAL